MPSTQAIKEFCLWCGRLVRERLTIAAIVLLVVGLTAGDPFNDYFLKRSTLGEAWNVTLANLQSFLTHPLVRFGFIVAALILFGFAARRVMKDQERLAAAEREHHAELVSSQEAFAASETAIRAETLEPLMRLMRYFFGSEKLRGAEGFATTVSTAIDAYTYMIEGLQKEPTTFSDNWNATINGPWRTLQYTWERLDPHIREVVQQPPDMGRLRAEHMPVIDPRSRCPQHRFDPAENQEFFRQAERVVRQMREYLVGLQARNRAQHEGLQREYAELRDYSHGK